MRLVIRDNEVLVSGSLVAADIERAQKKLGNSPKKASGSKPSRSSAKPSAKPTVKPVVDNVDSVTEPDAKPDKGDAFDSLAFPEVTP